jgi:hypothetical protein
LLLRLGGARVFALSTAPRFDLKNKASERRHKQNLARASSILYPFSTPAPNQPTNQHAYKRTRGILHKTQGESEEL